MIEKVVLAALIAIIAITAASSVAGQIRKTGAEIVCATAQHQCVTDIGVE